MNLAIIISVSEYTDKSNNLPGCKTDSEIIYNVLNKTGKYNEILYIHEKLTSAQVKERFTSFIADKKTNVIEELFFYFTGHGEFQNDEFYYILSDYNKDKRKQTTLQNEEVDSLFKTLNPNLTIKVIDACQSGKSYIKEIGSISKYFQKTVDRYTKCYFMNSSLTDQSSFQSEKISDFTLSFVKSIKEHTTNEIRYKDILDYISDEFENNAVQTPFFITQADYTERFCSIQDNLRNYLKQLDFSAPEAELGKEQGVTLLEKIKKDATNYFTKEQALELLKEIKTHIESYKLPSNFDDIFDLKYSFQENYDRVIQKKAIGEWLERNSHDFFARATYKTELKPQHRTQFNTLMIPNPFDDKYETVLDAFELEIEVPYKTIIITLDSLFPNVESFTTRIIYFVSKKLIRFFYFITNFEQKNWDDRYLNQKTEWFSMEFKINDTAAIFEGLDKIYSLLIDQAQKELDVKFNSPESGNN